MALDNAKWFDDNVYLNNKLAQLKAADADTYGSWKVADVEQAFVDAGFAKGAEGVFDHFNQYGNTADENLSPNSHFNADQYYIFKAANLYHDDDVSAVTDAEAAYVKTAIKEAGMSAWQHYVDYGTEEGVNPSNDFDTNKYLDAKAAALNAAKVDGKTTWTADEVAKAISDAGMNALSHAMQYADGTTAGEAAAPFDANGKVIDAYKVDNPVDAGNGETYTLTTSPDNIQGTSGDDTVNGYVDTAGTSSTFTSADTINGGAGTDTLNVVVDGNAAFTMPQADISNVEKFMIRDAGTDGTLHVWNFATIDGETEVWADRNVAALNFQNLANGTTVGVKGTNGVNNGAVQFSFENGTTSANVVLDGVRNGGAIASNTALTDVSIANENNASTVVGGVALGGSAKTLTITADANLTTGNVTGFAADAEIAVGGSAAAVDLAILENNVKSVDASGLTAGGVTARTAAGSTLTTFTGGAGADSLTLGAALGNAGKVSLGNGDDTFIATANTFVTNGMTVDGGAGKDTLSLAAVSVDNASCFKNFEYLNLNLATGNYELNILGMTGTEKLVMDTAMTGATSVTKLAANGAVLDVIGAGDTTNALTLGINGADTGTSDSFAVNFTNTKTGATTSEAHLVLTDMETVKVKSDGGSDVVNTLVYATGENTRATSGTVGQTVSISGDNDINLTIDRDGALVNTTIAVDAGSLTGALTMVGGSTAINFVNKVVGGSGDDTLVVGNRAVSVDLSKGGLDSLDASAALGVDNTTSVGNVVTITGASAKDTITTVANVTAKMEAATSTAGLTTEYAIWDALATAAAGHASQTAWANVNGTVYLVADADTTAGIAGDNLITLTGVTSLEGADIAAGVITLA